MAGFIGGAILGVFVFCSILFLGANTTSEQHADDCKLAGQMRIGKEVFTCYLKEK